MELNEEIPQVRSLLTSKVQAVWAQARDVRRAASTLVAGEKSATSSGMAKLTMSTCGRARIKASLTDIEEPPDRRPGGGQVRMKEVADISITPTP